MIENEYRNGESQRSVPVNNSRKRWRLAKRLQPTPLLALRDFYDARSGPTEPFYFYDPYETNPKFSCGESPNDGEGSVQLPVVGVGRPCNEDGAIIMILI